MIMRKARDEDARRLADADADGVSVDESRRVLDTAETARRSAETGFVAPPDASRRSAVAAGGGKPSPSDRTVSGRTVVIHREGEASKRLTVSTHLAGQHATSVRVTGGDTIIRYQSGDMVIKRGARRAQLRRQLIWAYALGYLLLFGAYLYFLIFGTTTITPEEFVQKAFSRRHSSALIDLERAAFEAMRGNRTPAEVRLAEPLAFYDENKDMIRVESGSRLTLVTGSKLGKAILDDQKKPANQQTFTKPLRLYQETYIANANWPYWLTVYNALGFFLLLFLFLWRPLLNYLGTQGKKTAAALRDAREAQEKAMEYRNKYRRLASDIQERGERMRTEAEAEAEAGLEAALAGAKRQAETIEGSIQGAIDAEAGKIAGGLGTRTVNAACDRAMALLANRLGPADHDAAVDELIADIASMRMG